MQSWSSHDLASVRIFFLIVKIFYKRLRYILALLKMYRSFLPHKLQFIRGNIALIYCFTCFFGETIA